MYQQPGRATKASTTLSTHFNEHVETDIVFIQKYMISHFVDRCTRWHSGRVIEDRTEDTLWNTCKLTWINTFGAPVNLVTDGESALVTAKNKSRFAALQTNLVVRAPGQHAHFAERHGAMLSYTTNCLIEDRKQCGISEPMPNILSEAILALNTLTCVGGTTPYQAVIGRQPGLLPPIDGNPPQDSVDGRKEQRIRELAIDAMIQASAQAQVYRARRHNQRGKHPEYKRGDMVDYFRPPSTKDVSDWHGPRAHSIF